MKTTQLVFAFAMLSVTGFAPHALAAPISIERPELEVGDSWSYQRTDLDNGQVIGTVTHEIVAKTADGYPIKVSGSGAFVQIESLTKNIGGVVDVDGKKTDTHWLDFPLTKGKSWQVKNNWKNPAGYVGYDDITYEVTGEETVVTPAGSFNTIKLSGSGFWGSTNARGTGSIKIQYWYSPEAKTVVRYERTAYNGGRVSAHFATVLMSYHLNPSAVPNAAQTTTPQANGAVSTKP